MRYRNFEINYLITLLSSTLGQRIPPNPVKALDWRELFYLAEYHEVTNLSYYSLIGFYDQIPEVWKERFSKVFRKWVSIQAIQEKEVQAVIDALEDHQISYVILKDWVMKRYYPQADMRAVEDVRILIQPRDQKAVKKMMREIGYRHETLDDSGTVAFYKSIRCRFLFSEKLMVENPKISPYYNKVWRKLKSAVGYGSRYAFSLDDFYIYMIAQICSDYAGGDVDARHVLDIHLYLKKHKEDLNTVYIETELKKLELAKMAKCLENVSALWLGVYEGDETQQCRDVEEYIWSKGSYGREVSAKLMPMLVDLEIWRIREARKKKMMKVIRWFFPDYQVMRGRYPSLEKWKALFPLYWIIRLISMAAFFLKLKLKALQRKISMKVNRIEDVPKGPLQGS